MSTDFGIRPVGVPVTATTVQPASQAVNEAVATQLPAGQSVTAADAGAALRNDAESVGDYISHQTYYDRASSTMVFTVIDRQTDQVVDQYPDEAVLRRRAYFQALDISKDAQSRVLPTDRLA
jgi:uncharacterized FlaG/YvyC family protein